MIQFLWWKTVLKNYSVIQIYNLYFISHTAQRMTKGQTNNNDDKSKKIEQGDIFFFYRPKVDTEEVKSIEDVQRFYMVVSPEDNNKYRLFLIGQKQLPEIVGGKSTSEEKTGR